MQHLSQWRGTGRESAECNKRHEQYSRSAPGPDGISCRFIKILLNTKLGRDMIREIPVSLKEGRIKVVFIPKNRARI